MSLNRVVLTGRLTRDVDLRQAKSGTTVANFTLAVDRRFKRDGQPEADFIRCTAFGKSADTLAQYFSKGSLIGIEGSIQTGSYEKNGQRINTFDVIVDNWTFLESKRESQNNQDNWQPNYQDEATRNTYGKKTNVSDDDLPGDLGDLPF